MGAPKMQLCWDCQNCRADKCSWHDGSYTPVPGWDAEPIVVRHRHQRKNGTAFFRDTDSYYIKACPNFIPDQSLKTTKGIQAKFMKLFLKINKIEHRISEFEGGH